MPERNGLSRLKMRVCRERIGVMILGLRRQRSRYRSDALTDLTRSVSRPESKVGRDLVVSAPARVEFLTQAPELLNEFHLDPRVHILRAGFKGRLRDIGSFFCKRFERLDQLLVLARGEHATSAERSGPRDRATDVLLHNPPVDRKRVVRCAEEFVGACAFVASAPHPAPSAHLLFPPVSKPEASRSVSEKRRMKPLASD